MTKGMDLKAKRPRFESIWSREFTFLLNNFGLLFVMFFVLVFTTFPMVSEAFWNEKVTVGPPIYNAFLQPLGLGVFFLMGVGTLFGWKKSSDDQLKKNFMVPVGAGLAAVALHDHMRARRRWRNHILPPVELLAVPLERNLDQVRHLSR